MTVRRGHDIEGELQNAERLLAGGPDETWGWGGAAGAVRVRERVDFIVEQAALHPGMRVLELGCGTGIFTRQVARCGAHIVAVDLAERLLERARREVHASNVEFVQGNLMDPSLLANERFDATFGVSILHHLDLDVALPAVGARLRPGARFVFSEPNLNNPLNRYWYFTPDMARRARLGMSPTEMAFERDELRDTLERHGFRVERLAHRDFLFPLTPAPFVPAVRRAGHLVERIPVLRRWSGSLWVSGTWSPSR